MSEQEGSSRQKTPRLLRRKRTEFKRQESWRYKRIKENWRKPRGIDSKMRKKVKGWPPSPNKGYRNPKKGRNLHPSGLREVRVMNLKDFEKIDPESEAVRIGHTVGEKKRIEIINRAKELGIRVLNLKEIEAEVPPPTGSEKI